MKPFGISPERQCYVVLGYKKKNWLASVCVSFCEKATRLNHFYLGEIIWLVLCLFRNSLWGQKLQKMFGYLLSEIHNVIFFFTTPEIFEVSVEFRSRKVDTKGIQSFHHMGCVFLIKKFLVFLSGASQSWLLLYFCCEPGVERNSLVLFIWEKELATFDKSLNPSGHITPRTE